MEKGTAIYTRGRKRKAAKRNESSDLLNKTEIHAAVTGSGSVKRKYLAVHAP